MDGSGEWLTRRCGWAESTVSGRADGFRVGHREGHRARHRGWRGQQEGARHFALATSIWLQMDHTDRMRRAHPKNIQWTGSLSHSHTLTHTVPCKEVSFDCFFHILLYLNHKVQRILLKFDVMEEHKVVHKPEGKFYMVFQNFLQIKILKLQCLFCSFYSDILK